MREERSTAMQLCSTILVTVSLCLSSSVSAQKTANDTLDLKETGWDTLNAKVEQLLKALSAEEALEMAEEALKVAEKQAAISSRVGLTTARLNALSALADYYRDHANSGYQSKEATESAEEMRKILEEVRSGDFVDISRVK